MKEFFCRLFTPWRAGAQFDAPEAFYGFLLARNKLLGIIRNLCFGAALVLLRLCGKAASKMPLVAAVPLAVYTVAHFLPPAATVAAVAFVAFSVVMLWFAASMIRAYNDARIKK